MVCRPLLLYAISKDLRRAANHLLLTVIRSRVVWALTFSFLMVSSLLGVALLQHLTPPESGPQFEVGLGRAFQDARSAFIQMFIFVCTAAVRLACSMAHSPLVFRVWVTLWLLLQNYPIVSDHATSASQYVVKPALSWVALTWQLCVVTFLLCAGSTTSSSSFAPSWACS